MKLNIKQNSCQKTKRGNEPQFEVKIIRKALVKYLKAITEIINHISLHHTSSSTRL